MPARGTPPSRELVVRRSYGLAVRKCGDDGRLQRGKVDCRISLTAPASATSAEPRLNRELLQQLIALQRDVRTVSAAARELSVGEILRWPGVMATDTPVSYTHLTLPTICSV